MSDENSDEKYCERNITTFSTFPINTLVLIQQHKVFGTVIGHAFNHQNDLILVVKCPEKALPDFYIDDIIRIHSGNVQKLR